MHKPSNKLCNHVAYTVHTVSLSLKYLENIIFLVLLTFSSPGYCGESTLSHSHTKEFVQYWKHEEHEDCLSKSSLT